VPPGSANYVRERVGTADQVCQLVGRVDALGLEPIQDACPTTPVVAYVALSHANLKAVFYLSGRGLREVFVHPVADVAAG
jgi:hypothetical protein